jgi:RNA polymerase sigma-70 factor (ECF subfamily)
MQDTFLNVFKHLDNFRGESRFATWLTSITINQARMAMRAKPRKATALDEVCGTETKLSVREIPAGGYTPEQLCSQRELKRLLVACTAGMSARLRQVWQLRTVDGLAEKEIAKVLGLTLTTTKSRLFRARRELYKRMGNHINSTHGGLC